MIVADVLLFWQSCYDAETIRELAAPLGTEFTALDVLRAEHIAPQDRLQAVLRLKVLPARVLRRLAADYAERKLLHERAAGREPDPRSWVAIENARKHARGEITDEELAAVLVVARTAPGSRSADLAQKALWASPGFVAHLTSWYACNDVPWTSDRAIAQALAWKSGEDSAENAELCWQVQHTIEVIEGARGGKG